MQHFNPVYVADGSKTVRLKASTCSPVLPHKRTLMALIGTSESCQNRTHAPQQRQKRFEIAARFEF